MPNILKSYLKFFFKKFANNRTSYVYLHHQYAEVAQLVELQPSKLVVASSSLVFRSKVPNESLGLFFCSKFSKEISLSSNFFYNNLLIFLRSQSRYSLQFLVARLFFQCHNRSFRWSLYYARKK